VNTSGCCVEDAVLDTAAQVTDLHDHRTQDNDRIAELPAAQGDQGPRHFPGDDAVVKLLWLAIINIEDKRARERAARWQETGKRADQPARLIEGQRVMGWREALNELDIAYPGRIR
jgi:hypothetical protein